MDVGGHPARGLRLRVLRLRAVHDLPAVPTDVRDSDDHWLRAAAGLANAPGQLSPTYAETVDNVNQGTLDDRLHLRITGHDAQCFSEAVGPSEIGEGYAAFCLIERDGGFVKVSVFAPAPREDGVATDGTVVTSRATTVPDEAKVAARSLRDAIAQSVQFD